MPLNVKLLLAFRVCKIPYHEKFGFERTNRNPLYLKDLSLLSLPSHIFRSSFVFLPFSGARDRPGTNYKAYDNEALICNVNSPFHSSLHSYMTHIVIAGQITAIWSQGLDTYHLLRHTQLGHSQ